jgi:hypothetical protein
VSESQNADPGTQAPNAASDGGLPEEELLAIRRAEFERRERQRRAALAALFNRNLQTGQRQLQLQPVNLDHLINNVGKVLFPVVNAIVRDQPEHIRIIARHLGSFGAALGFMISNYDGDEELAQYAADGIAHGVTYNRMGGGSPKVRGDARSKVNFEWNSSRGQPEQGPSLEDRKRIIIRRLEDTYGLNFPQADGSTIPWDIDDLLAISKAMGWIQNTTEKQIANLEDYENKFVSPLSAQDVIRRAFSGTQIHLGSDNSPQAAIAVVQGSASVPPPGLGGTGRDVYMPEGFPPDIFALVFLHETGHVLDFKGGTTYTEGDITDPANTSNPSTLLINQTFGTDMPGIYLRGPLGLPTLPFSLQALLGIGYWPQGKPTDYGSTNHYEDFAETWYEYNLQQNGYNVSDVIGDERLQFMDEHMLDFILQAGS